MLYSVCSFILFQDAWNIPGKTVLKCCVLKTLLMDSKLPFEKFLCALSVDIFWTSILIKEFSKEVFHFIKMWIYWMASLAFWLQQTTTLSGYYIHPKHKRKLAPARQYSKKCFFFYPFYLEVTIGQRPRMSVTISD